MVPNLGTSEIEAVRSSIPQKTCTIGSIVGSAGIHNAGPLTKTSKHLTKRARKIWFLKGAPSQVHGSVGGGHDAPASLFGGDV